MLPRLDSVDTLSRIINNIHLWYSLVCLIDMYSFIISFTVEVYLEEPLWPDVSQAKAAVILESIALCSQMDLLCRKELSQVELSFNFFCMQLPKLLMYMVT